MKDIMHSSYVDDWFEGRLKDMSQPTTWANWKLNVGRTLIWKRHEFMPPFATEENLNYVEWWFRKPISKEAIPQSSYIDYTSIGRKNSRMSKRKMIDKFSISP